MRLPSVPTLPMVEYLNTQYFNRVWNAPDDHGRANFQLYKAAQRLQIGAVPIVNQSVVGLPTTDSVYAVYRVADHAFGRFVSFDPNVWITDADLFAKFAVSSAAYSADGRLIPAGKIFLRYDPVRSMVLIAIDIIYTSKCIGVSYPDLYMTVYFDTSRDSPIKTQVFKVSTSFGQIVTPQQVTTAIQTAKAQYPNGTSVFVNGWLYDPANVPALNTGDIIEIVSDPDVVGYCDISVDDNVTGYFSTLFGEYREVIHIPKQLNPNNIIITHDTLTIGVFDIATKRGVYGHRVDPHAIESITHNDFSISRSVLQAYQNTLSSQGVFVRIYVRYPTMQNKLDHDVNHISDMYSLPDTEIQQQLTGLSTHQIQEWKASHLEQSPFLDLLYRFDGFSSDIILEQFSSAMGYYDVAATLAQSMYYCTYSGSQFTVTKPKRLWGYACNVIVYADGRKIPDDALEISDYSCDAFLLGFKTGSYVAIGSRIAIYVTESGYRIPVPYSPTQANPSILLDSDDYSLYKIISYDTPQSVWGETTQTGYCLIPVSPADYTTESVVTLGVTQTKLTAKSIHWGEQFQVMPNVGMVTSVYPLDGILAAKQPIVIPLKMIDSGGQPITLFGYGALEIYINGYRLIEGIDYTCNPIEGPNGDILQTLLEVSNMDYLDLAGTGNILETVVHGDSVASRDRGYVVSNMMHRDSPPMFWSRSCGRAYANGLLIEHVSENGDTVTSAQTISDGSPYLLEWTLPYGVQKLMASLSPNSDTDLLNRIDKVLGTIEPVYPSIALVSHLHALYSPYLAKIVSDVGNGILTIVDDPKDDTFLAQFMKYEFLLPRDPTIGASNPLIDRRFVTLSAHYANYSVQDSGQMLLVQRLINLLLTPSELSINEVLV